MAIRKRTNKRSSKCSILAGFALAGAAILALLPWSSPASAAPQQVDLKLVLATDVSRSMDNDEFGIEREGTAQAFLDPDVIRGIQSGTLGRIAVALVDFSSPEFNKTVIDWKIIRDRAGAASLADAIRNAPRTPGRRTSISGALEFASLLLVASDKDIVATRRVIDVSGDGPNNDGNPMTEVHDKTIAQGITINGLPVMDDQANGYYPDLDKYYAGCVAGGRGAFVVVVRSYKDFGAAMRHKLILEISQNASLLKQAEAAIPPNRLLLKIANTHVAPALQVLRPGPNDFTKQCDVHGGFGGFGGGGFGRY